MVAPLLIHSLNGLLIVYSGKDMVALLIELYEWKILQHKYLSSKQPQKQSINFCGGVLCDQEGGRVRQIPRFQMLLRIYSWWSYPKIRLFIESETVL